MAFKTNKTPVLQTKSASGSVASFNTALAMPLSSCNIDVNAWQEGSGDPSPDNVRPIHGFSEVNAYQRAVNLWDEEWELGAYWNNTGLPRELTDRIRCKNAIPIKQNTEIYTPFSMDFLFYDINENVLPSVARTGYSRADNMYLRQSSNTEGKFLIPQGAYYMRFYMQASYGTTYNNDISVNYPSTDTDYHAYNGTQYTKQLGEDVYGGSYNSVSGKKSKTWDKFKIRDFTWVYNATSAYFATNTTGKAFGSTNLICEVLTIDTRSSGSMANYTIKGADSAERIIIKDTNATSSTELINDIGDYYIAFELAETIESNIGATPIETYDGANNIFCDTGDTSLTYKDLDLAKRGNFREVFRLPS